MEDGRGGRVRHNAAQRLGIPDVDLVEPRGGGKLCAASGRQIVDDVDIGARGEQGVGEVRTDEAGSTSDQDGAQESSWHREWGGEYNRTTWSLFGGGVPIVEGPASGPRTALRVLFEAARS